MTRFNSSKRNEKVGKIVYNKEIIDEIVMLAISELEHVELYTVGPNKRIKKDVITIDFDKDWIKVDVKVTIDAQERVPDVAFKIQEAIRHSVETMTEYHVLSVNVIIDGITFNEIVPQPIDTNQDN